jgi:uncharacterized iron-regulated protein
MRLRALGLSLFMCLVACAHGGQLTPKAGFQLPLGREHPLAGRIWSRKDNAFIEPQLLESRVRASSWLILGETHDNFDHHLLQADLLAIFLAVHPTASIGFEMLDETQAPLLTPPLPENPDEFAARVHWSESGWPDFALYRPVFREILARHARIVAAHPSHEHVSASMAGIPPELAKELALDQPLPDAALNALVEEIRTSHCGFAPEEMIAPMVNAQMFKDAWMALELGKQGVPAALITGRGHADITRGVPLYLQRRGVKGDVLSIGFLDVDDAKKQVSDYQIATDFTVFTPRASNESACDRFREQLKRMQHAHATQT